MMSSRCESGLVSLVPFGPVDAAALVWRAGRELQLTVMVKARFALVADRRMRPLPPLPLVERDRHHGGDATRSLAVASDVVPFRPRVDVTLTGHAVAPRGRPSQAVAVRLAIVRAGAARLDKVVHVYGDRAAAADAPSAFEHVPLVYERAFGGPGHDANPVGTGADGRSRPPNLVDPTHPRALAGFGPISRYWKARRQFVSSEQRRDLERIVPSVPSALDWRYFQAAPEDQQLEGLDGDEWVVLDGVHPDMARVQSQLPSAGAFARLVPTTGGPGELVAMVADTLAVDVDALEATLTFRGVVRLGGLAELGRLRGLAGLGVDGVMARSAEIEAQLASSPTLLESLPIEARQLLGAAPSGRGAAPDGGDPLVRTDVDHAVASASNDPLMRTSPDAAGEPTLRSRVSPRVEPVRGGEAHPDTLTHIDVAALRASIADGEGTGGGAEEHPFERTIPTVAYGRSRRDLEDTVVNLRLPMAAATDLTVADSIEAELADATLASDDSTVDGDSGEGASG
jgi:hypothetical protein